LIKSKSQKQKVNKKKNPPLWKNQTATENSLLYEKKMFHTKAQADQKICLQSKMHGHVVKFQA
jgi:hypothetical protein